MSVPEKMGMEIGMGFGADKNWHVVRLWISPRKHVHKLNQLKPFAQLLPIMDRVITELTAGKVKGVRGTLPDGNPYYWYKGIPYAKPPVGELRFKPPVPLEKFEEDVLDCSYERNVSHALMHYPPAVAQGEDCLHANVYTTLSPDEVHEGKLLPVMVWIYGGAFNCGSGNSSLYEPSYLVQEGVVAVTFNYRVGPLGFLCLPSAGIYGNMGLKDQRLLLKWVHDNITRFGGDPSNVTVFGESAGAASTHLQYLSKESRKYFNRVICQSGMALNIWVKQHECETKARKLAKLLGCSEEDDAAVYKTLMSASASELTALAEHCMSLEDSRRLRIFAFTPVIEVEEADEPFITENVLTLMKSPNFTDKPIIYGFTSNEAASMMDVMFPVIESFFEDPTMYVPAQLDVPDNLRSEVGEKIQRFYFKNQKPSKEDMQSLLDFISDEMFIIPSYVSSELQARYQHSAPQFFYQFSFEGSLACIMDAFPFPFPFKPTGVCHIEDCSYLFKHEYLAIDEAKVDDRARNFRETLCRLWTNFAKYGHPTPASDDRLNFTWEPVKPVASDNVEFVLHALDLDESFKMIEEPLGERVKFWKQIFAEYGGKFLDHCTLK
ncbi:carboxylic ester hydrolase-like [Uranotaenia lowii]|uniref:carboxylic ester hydrolase-like n=1 Tax=Uranotaenia lowii TaxID=190385 RepID=UPI002478E751|nr:carboxylic ester hydrolase-like [Uranotaenia lowii]